MPRLLVLATLCLCAAPIDAQLIHYQWWLAPDVQLQLRLTPEQVKSINAVFESTLAARRAQREELDTLDRQVDALLDGATADDRAAAALITRVEAARARRNVARMVMLYRMRRILTPAQRHWFDTHRARSSPNRDPRIR